AAGLGDKQRRFRHLAVTEFEHAPTADGTRATITEYLVRGGQRVVVGVGLTPEEGVEAVAIIEIVAAMIKPEADHLTHTAEIAHSLLPHRAQAYRVHQQ